MYSLTGDEYIEKAVENYSDAMLNAAYSILKSTADAEDVVQEAFLKYIRKRPVFNSDEHEKAWLIKVASNICKDILRKRKHYSFVSLDEIRNLGTSENNAQILGMLVSLEEKYRIVIHLHYVEGYKAGEIASMLGITEAAVKKRLQRGRDALREIYEKEAR